MTVSVRAGHLRRAERMVAVGQGVVRRGPRGGRVRSGGAGDGLGETAGRVILGKSGGLIQISGPCASTSMSDPVVEGGERWCARLVSGLVSSA
jgi:hypothetical protein